MKPLDTLQQSYEQILYPDLAFAQTHPDRLATLANLLGLQPAPITACRVLELGCASGGNLVPMAYGLPDSQFVGLDFSARQVARGQRMVEALGLENISLQPLNILQVQADFGQFDYIIAHGLYSWTPPEVRDKVLQICGQNLAPNGVAYVSYNAFPGWHLMGIVRDAMLFRTRGLIDPVARAKEARQALDFLTKAVPTKHHVYGQFMGPYLAFLQDQMERVGPKADAFLLHDELEEYNEAVYFYQFAEHAAQHGLQYLTEADFPTVMPDQFPQEVMQDIGQLASNLIEMEQYMDFARNRLFRQTLLCHEGQSVQRGLNPERLRNFRIASRSKLLSDEPDLYAPTVEQFRSYDGATLSTDHPVSKAAMAHLIEIWPRSIPFDDLLQIARQQVRKNDGPVHDLEVDMLNLAANLLRAFCHSMKLVEFHSYAPQFTTTVSDRPTASPVARYQVQSDSTLRTEKGVKVTNVYQESVTLDQLNAYLLPYLDGQHSQAELINIVQGLVANGTIEVKHEGSVVTKPEAQRLLIEKRLGQQLQWFADVALLVA